MRIAASLSLLLCLALGCATPGQESAEPAERAWAILEEWRARRSRGAYCQDADGIPRDCEKLRVSLERLALEFPRQPQVLFANALMSFDANDAARAQSWLNALFGVAPSHPEGALLRVRIALADGNLPFARRVLEEQTRLRPDHAGLREAQAALAYLEHDLAAASEALELASRLGAPAWRVAYHAGLIAERAGRADEAARAYRSSLESRPDFEAAEIRLRALEARAPTR